MLQCAVCCGLSLFRCLQLSCLFVLSICLFFLGGWVYLHSYCVAVSCSVVQCRVVCCSVLQCVAVCCGVLRCVAKCPSFAAFASLVCAYVEGAGGVGGWVVEWMGVYIFIVSCHCVVSCAVLPTQTHTNTHTHTHTHAHTHTHTCSHTYVGESVSCVGEHTS